MKPIVLLALLLIKFNFVKPAYSNVVRRTDGPLVSQDGVATFTPESAVLADPPLSRPTTLLMSDKDAGSTRQVYRKPQKRRLMSALTESRSTEEARIIGGQESEPYSHPYLVSIQSRFLFLRFHVCGGSILNERWVLTAAHCTKDSWLIRWLPLDAVAGDHDVHNIGPRAQIKPVDIRIEHPLYNGDIGPHDIAVLRLKDPFTFTGQVQAIHLPYDEKISNADPLILAGWGVLKTTIFLPDLPNGLQEVKVNYIPYEECRKAVDKIKDAFEYNPLNKDANICTGPITGGVAACSGDSGGPLIQMVPKNKIDHRTKESDVLYDEVQDANVGGENTTTNTTVEESTVNDEEKIPVVRGIVSWGVSPCGDRGAPTVYTKISQYIDFIKAHIKF